MHSLLTRVHIDAPPSMLKWWGGWEGKQGKQQNCPSFPPHPPLDICFLFGVCSGCLPCPVVCLFVCCCPLFVDGSVHHWSHFETKDRTICATESHMSAVRVKSLCVALVAWDLLWALGLCHCSGKGQSLAPLVPLLRRRS